MNDLRFNPDINDIIFTNWLGTFTETDYCGNQNAILIFNKDCVDITRAQFGVGFENIYPNSPKILLPQVTLKAEKQLRQDGAFIGRISVDDTNGDVGEYQVDINVKYRGE